MKKFKPVISLSIFCAVILSVIAYWIPQIDWPFLPYLVLAGIAIVFIQKETVSYKFLDKLLAGSFILGFFLSILIFFRMYAMSYLVYDAPMPLKELWNKDMFILVGAYAFLGFLGGLIGIAFKGVYSLYKEKLNWVIIFIGPLLVTISSLAVFRTKVGGTIMSGYYGLPYSYFTYQIKDVVDGFTIDKWIFLPGSFYHYIILNYFLYFSIFILAFCLIKFINKKLTPVSINATFLLFALLISMMIAFTSFMSVKMSFIEHKISSVLDCETVSDCVIVGNVSPFSCVIVSNKDNAGKILKLVKSYPSTGVLNCSGMEKAACIQNKCRVSIDHTPNETYWEMLKKSIENCEVASIIQTHNLKVTAVLKSGRVIEAVEPGIDDIFDIVMKFKNSCGDIIMGTE